MRGVLVSGRWLVVLAWVTAALWVVLVPPPAGGGGGGGDVGSLLPADSEAVEVQQRSLAQFAVPVLSQTAVVVHDPNGLALLTRLDAALWALSHTRATLDGQVPSGGGHILAAVPIPTASPDTAVSYLYVSPGTSLDDTVELAHEYAAHFDQPGVQTYVTGLLPAQVQQADYLRSRLGVFEIATLLLITGVVALVFRSLVAPLVVLVVVALGFLVAYRLLTVAAGALGFVLPDQLRPLTAALFIGVVTDYCVLLFYGFRQQLERGLHRHEAAWRMSAAEGPLIAVAGLTVAGGTAALLAADFVLFRAFGPALALTVLLGVLVSLTLVPALLAILGSALFAPRRIRQVPPPAEAPAQPGRLIRTVADRRGATVATVLGVALLALAAVPLLFIRLDVSFTAGLPPDDPVRQGAQVLDASGVGGIVAPTEVLVEGPDVAEQRAALDRLQEAIRAQPGVAQVLGPAQNPLPQEFGIVFSRDGDAARFVVVFDSDPLTAPAIADLTLLQERLPALLAEAGVENAGVAVTGQTAIAAELTELTREDLWVTLVAVLAVELVILVVYLRALVAPVALLAASALGVAAALGLSVLVFQGLLGASGLTFYVPFVAAVLLLALGSDYNVFAVGSIWRAAAHHPLSRAIAVAMPATGRAISAAGIILAATFAMLAIIPLGPFLQLAFTMTVGLLLDTFLVRPVLTPAVLTLLGRTASWPSRRIRTTAAPREELRQTALSGEGAPHSLLSHVCPDRRLPSSSSESPSPRSPSRPLRPDGDGDSP
ncbi:putative drug exporter of the RND superfamily [Blastococcus mobilis]|uniref:Putative drug exporter of the RND superfamily n=1 Tax=Blastococcus mobilis TaxID=1938746 RepID=A0A238UTM0_9ACTN|nr:putative drug exporter of the RND superfamily [Blastococcus mobilis]